MKSWAIYIAVALGFVMYEAATSVDRDSTGAIVGQGSVDAFQVQVGDCFNDSYEGQGEFEVSDVPGVPCTEAHDNEAFAVFDVNIAIYPQGDGMGSLAYESCLAHFEAFVGRDYHTSTLEITTLYPSQEGWGQSDREVVCAVYDVNENKLIGSARNRGL